MSDGAPEQSMEEILASIKRVIDADTQGLRRPAPLPEQALPEEEDVLELGDPASPPISSAPSAPSTVTMAGAGDPDALISGASAEAAKAALAQLSSLAIDPKAADNTLDGLVREMLRPMLKAWLDANLPDLVERIVSREVARVVGR